MKGGSGRISVVVSGVVDLLKFSEERRLDRVALEAGVEAEEPSALISV